MSSSAVSRSIGGAALGPVQLEVGPVEVTHDPFGIKKIFELA